MNHRKFDQNNIDKNDCKARNAVIKSHSKYLIQKDLYHFSLEGDHHYHTYECRWSYSNRDNRF